MTSDIQFTIGDKSTADMENEKLKAVENILLQNTDLSPEDLTLLTQAIHEGANDAIAETTNLDNNTDEYIDDGDL